jgi:cytochrome oxidase assembly protein ShyY1
MADMYRFLLTPKWIGFHLLVVVCIVAMVNFGFWQLRRLDEKQAFNARVEQRYDADVVPLDELLVPGADPDDLEWRPVAVSGVYEPTGTVQIVNRSQFGQAGENTVTPMRLEGGQVLIVNRGFLPLDVAAPPPPVGTVSVTGRLRLTQVRTFAQLGDPDTGVLTVAQRVDIDRLAQQIEGEVLPMYLDVYESSPTEAEPQPQPVVAPELGEGNHLSYAVQWFVFSAAVAIGWVLAVRRSLRTHRHELDEAVDATADTSTRTPSSADEAPVRQRRYTDH